MSSGIALVGDVGRSAVRFALTDEDGNLRDDSIRPFEAAKHTTISGALMAYRDTMGLSSLPTRCCIAVAGIPRGDAVSITGSRWFISKTGLASMLQYEPLVINDFAANAWAVSAASPQSIEALETRPPTTGPGTFVVIGTGTGLGVASFTRHANGGVSVVATEAGHSELYPNIPEIQSILQLLRREVPYVCAETLLSAGGLARMRTAVSDRAGSSPPDSSPEGIIRAASHGDADARKACTLFAQALWEFAGNLTMIYGAWDGVYLIGNMVKLLRPFLARPETRQAFVIRGPYAKLLESVPAATLLPRHAELRGAAEAARRAEW